MSKILLIDNLDSLLTWAEDEFLSEQYTQAQMVFSDIKTEEDRVIFGSDINEIYHECSRLNIDISLDDSKSLPSIYFKKKFKLNSNY